MIIRWKINSELRNDFDLTNLDKDKSDETIFGLKFKQFAISDKLPLKMFNNYFSLGADAAMALEFHQSRGLQNKELEIIFLNN